MTIAQQLEQKGIEKGIEKGIFIGERQGIEKGITIGERQGITKGISIGEQKGRQEGKLEVARAMLAGGIDPASVMRMTALSEEDMKQLNH